MDALSMAYKTVAVHGDVIRIVDTISLSAIQALVLSANDEGEFFIECTGKPRDDASLALYQSTHAAFVEIAYEAAKLIGAA